MKKTVYNFLAFGLFFLLITFLACSEGRIDDTWTLRPRDIREGEGENDIPAINEPRFAAPADVDFLTDSSMVLGLNIGGTLRAYPLDILYWHEIVNDEIADSLVAVTYSTLTGSGVAFHRRIDNNISFKLRVSGLLYRNNLIVLDDLYESHWVQFQRLGVSGSRSNENLEEFPIIEINWKTWQLLFPNSEVLTTRTGFNRPYGTYPYGDYQTDDTNFFFGDTSLFNLTKHLYSFSNPISFKDRVLGIIVGEDAKVYPFSAFPKTGIGIIEDEFRGEQIIVIGSQEANLLVAYRRTRTDGSIASFEVVDSEKLLIKDERGVEFDVFGKTTNNISAENLNAIRSNIGYCFAWLLFYPNVEVY